MCSREYTICSAGSAKYSCFCNVGTPKFQVLFQPRHIVKRTVAHVEGQDCRGCGSSVKMSNFSKSAQVFVYILHHIILFLIFQVDVWAIFSLLKCSLLVAPLLVESATVCDYGIWLWIWLQIIHVMSQVDCSSHVFHAIFFLTSFFISSKSSCHRHVVIEKIGRNMNINHESSVFRGYIMTVNIHSTRS